MNPMTICPSPNEKQTSASETQTAVFDDTTNPSGLPFPALEVAQVRLSDHKSQWAEWNFADGKEKPTMPDANPDFEDYYFGDPSAWTFDNLWTFDQLDLPEI